MAVASGFFIGSDHVIAPPQTLQWFPIAVEVKAKALAEAYKANTCSGSFSF